MTRFARAKGSKSSNERVVSDPTPWHEIKNQMSQKKQQFEEEKKRKEAEAKRNENYQNFLNERKKESKGPIKWADFPEENGPKVNGLSDKSKSIKKQKIKGNEKKIKRKVVHSLDEGTIIQKDSNDEILNKKTNGDETSNETEMKKEKSIPKEVQNNNECSEESDDDAPIESSSKVEISAPVVKKVKIKKKKIVIPSSHSEKNDKLEAESTGESPEKTENGVLLTEEQKRKILNKKERRRKQIEKKKLMTQQNSVKTEGKTTTKKNVRKEIDLESLPEEERKKILKKREKRNKQVEKKKLKKQQQKIESGTNDSENCDSKKGILNNTDTNQKAQKNVEKKTFNKITNNNELKRPRERSEGKKMSPKKQKLENGDIRRQDEFKPKQIMVNGIEIEIDYVDGFPIKKEDAEHIKTLRKEMISKGLPRSEIDRSLKLERRRAEKALAREKKKVCFNCRKFGHNLSECPNLSNKNDLVEMSSGICFKCGSPDHTSFACRVVKGQNFRFATCFICKEQGHLSKQCPDNANGMYPKGGSCRVCGDTTHLKKDCRQYQEQQRQKGEKFHVESMYGGNPDDIDTKNEVKPFVEPKQPKIIKF